MCACAPAHPPASARPVAATRSGPWSALRCVSSLSVSPGPPCPSAPRGGSLRCGRRASLSRRSLRSLCCPISGPSARERPISPPFGPVPPAGGDSFGAGPAAGPGDGFACGGQAPLRGARPRSGRHLVEARPQASRYGRARPAHQPRRPAGRATPEPMPQARREARPVPTPHATEESQIDEQKPLRFPYLPAWGIAPRRLGGRALGIPTPGPRAEGAACCRAVKDKPLKGSAGYGRSLTARHQSKQPTAGYPLLGDVFV